MTQAEPLLCGIDEAGRAPLAGPVVAACVIVRQVTLEQNPALSAINDSKAISRSKREALADILIECCAYGIAGASVEEIDDMNIHHASLLAMQRACQAMCTDFDVAPDYCNIDGKFVPDNLPCPAEALIKGDARCRHIGAASILAKVHRDRHMGELDRDYPGYGWARNAGYPTREHITALHEHGITPHHRQSFAPVRQLGLPLGA
jgi:ribonuclease HII